MAGILGLIPFGWKSRRITGRTPSLIETFDTMVRGGEMDSSEAEERFREIWMRALPERLR